MNTNKQKLLDMIAKLQSAVESDTEELANISKIHSQIMEIDTAAFDIYKEQFDKEEEHFEKEMESLNAGKHFN